MSEREEAETAAQGVAELVVQTHSNGSEATAGQPCGPQQVGAGVGVVEVRDHAGECAGDVRDGFERHQVGDRIALCRVQRLDRMRQTC